MADIELVIRVDEDTYKDIKNGKVYSSMRDVPQESVLAISNGTPLPRGHGRLIDADDLLKKHPEFDTYPFPSTTVDNAPPIIEADKAESEERNMADMMKWIKVDKMEYWRCPNCNHEVTESRRGEYCHYCGFPMRENLKESKISAKWIRHDPFEEEDGWASWASTYYECSNCGHHDTTSKKYCPRCGAKIVESEE